jgi:hypothetical protein
VVARPEETIKPVTMTWDARKNTSPGVSIFVRVPQSCWSSFLRRLSSFFHQHEQFISLLIPI